MVRFVKYRQVTESENLDPILKLMFDVIDERQLQYKCVANAIGVSAASLKKLARWKNDTNAV